MIQKLIQKIVVKVTDFLTCRVSFKYCLNGVNIQIVLDFITAGTLWLHISLETKKAFVDDEFTRCALA